jgi:transposase
MTKEQLNELRRAYRTAKDGAERTRYQAVWLYGQGDLVADICRITGCSPTSLMEWNRQYREQGLEGLVDQRNGRNRAKLTPEQTDELSEKLRLYTPRDLFGPETYTASGQHWTVEDLARAVQQWYEVSWQSRTSYHTLFARCAFSYQRTEKVYQSRRERDGADWEAQVEKN